MISAPLQCLPQARRCTTHVQCFAAGRAEGCSTLPGRCCAHAVSTARVVLLVWYAVAAPLTTACRAAGASLPVSCVTLAPSVADCAEPGLTWHLCSLHAAGVHVGHATHGWYGSHAGRSHCMCGPLRAKGRAGPVRQTMVFQSLCTKMATSLQPSRTCCGVWLAGYVCGCAFHTWHLPHRVVAMLRLAWSAATSAVIGMVQ